MHNNLYMYNLNISKDHLKNLYLQLLLYNHLLFR